MAKNLIEKKQAHIYIRVPAETKRRLRLLMAEREYATGRTQSLNGIIVEAVNVYLTSEGKNK